MERPIYSVLLFLDGVYRTDRLRTRFRWVKAPTSDELTQLTHSIVHRVTRPLERLCRYIARLAVSTQRLSLTRNGQVRYELKTPYSDGTTHVIFEPLDIMYRMYGMPRAQGCARLQGEGETGNRSRGWPGPRRR